MTCPLCGQSLSKTCCHEEQGRHDAYRARQQDLEELFHRLGIETRQNPSREVLGEWATEPHLPSLVAFLAELPFPPDRVPPLPPAVGRSTTTWPLPL